MRKKKYLIEIQNSKNSEQEVLLHLFQNKNQRFKLLKIDLIKVIEIKNVDHKTFIKIESESDIEGIVDGCPDILFKNRALNDSFDLINEVYDEFERFCDLKISLGELEENILNNKRDWVKRDPDVFYLIKAFINREKKILEKSHLTKTFYDYLEFKKETSIVRILKHYKNQGGYPKIEHLIKKEVPKEFENLNVIHVDLKNVILSLNLKVSVKNIESNCIEFEAPKSSCFLNKEF